MEDPTFNALMSDVKLWSAFVNELDRLI